MPEAEETKGKKQPQGPSFWQRGNLKGILTMKEGRGEDDQLEGR